MANITKIDGIETGDIEKVDGVAASDIQKVSGVTKSLPAITAGRWLIVADAGKIYHTTTSDGSGGWGELVDLGATTGKSVAIGKDDQGEKRWVVQSATNSEEINYASASADISNSSNWTTVNFPTNYIGTDGGPGVAWGNDVWISTGKRIHDGDSYRTIMRSTDGAVTWASVDHGSSINDNANCVAYKGTGQTWALGHQSHIWVSTNDGASWTDTATLEGTKDINAICYDGSSKWLAVLQSSNVYYSTDDWAANTEGTLSGQGNQYGCVYMKGDVNKFISVSSAGQINHSPDGATWTEASDYDDTKVLYAIATDHTTVIAVGNAGIIMTSTDGDTWTIRTITGVTKSFRGIACDVIGAGLY
jgi:photosystem II stability/assembly factor-like uncharacterized protein